MKWAWLPSIVDDVKLRDMEEDEIFEQEIQEMIKEEEDERWEGDEEDDSDA